MLKRTWLIYAVIFSSLILYSFVNFETHLNIKFQQENHRPVVKIVAPKDNGVFDPDAPVNYSITVSDKEDGESKYDEINVKEVLLEVRYVKNNSKVKAGSSGGAKSDQEGLAVMRTSNCFNCHNFNSKSIGPSFYEINKRYPASKANLDSMVKRIREGSSGIWGKEKMPTHPELTKEETKNAVQWILKHAADKDVSYYIGTGGTFRINPPATPNQKGIYILTASYADHGLKNMPGKNLVGEDVIVIHSK